VSDKEREARRELAEIISHSQNFAVEESKTPEIGSNASMKSIQAIGDAPVSLTLRGLKLMMAAERSYAIDAVLRVLARNRWALHLPAQKLKQLIEIEAGLRKGPDNK